MAGGTDELREAEHCGPRCSYPQCLHESWGLNLCSVRGDSGLLFPLGKTGQLASS